jgi:hypothetical protein
MKLVGLRKIEIWRMEPVPRKVAAVGEELFDMFNRLRREQMPDDLGTDWFGRMLAAIFKNDPAGSIPTFTVLNTAGTSVTPYAKRNANVGIFNDTAAADCGAYIGVGTSTITPQKQDTALKSEVARNPASAGYTDGGDRVTVSASFTLASTTNINEVGLYWKQGAPVNVWLLDRTVLTTAVTFPANTAMLVAYVFAV